MSGPDLRFDLVQAVFLGLLPSRRKLSLPSTLLALVVFELITCFFCCLISIDDRNKGWNLAVKSTFASKADMDYYDKECEAHKALKKVSGAVRTDNLTVWFESALGNIQIPT